MQLLGLSAFAAAKAEILHQIVSSILAASVSINLPTDIQTNAVSSDK